MNRLTRGWKFLLVLCGLLAWGGSLFPAALLAQGLLIHIQPADHVPLPRPIIIYPPHPHPHPRPRPTPVPESTYKIKALEVNARINEQVASVQVSQSFVNTGSRQMEVSFVFPLPYDGAIDQLTLLVDGKEYPAKLLDAKAARSQYEAIVRKNQDPALLEWLGTGMFQTSVFPVPPGAERKVTLRYTQLCRKLDGMTDFLFPLSTAKYTSEAIEEIKFQLHLDSKVEIKNIYSPSHAIDIQRPDGKSAVISYSAKSTIPTGDFRLLYDVGAGQVNASVIAYRPTTDEEGYLLLLASPQIAADMAERPKKTVLFVVDKSGSMSGKKMEQAKGALKFVLNNLRDGDTFNVIAYDDKVESWKPEVQTFGDETRKSALGYVEGLYAGGSTNISGALKTALAQIQDASRPNFVIFLTDGLPTAGETNEQKIVTQTRELNKLKARIFAFGVGYDLNSRLLDKLVRENFGLSEFVRPNEDIEARVSALYNRIGAPVMSDVAIKFDLDGHKTEDGPLVNRQYPQTITDLFAGEQLVIVGRYKKHGAAKVTVTGKVGGKEVTLDFPANLVEKSADDSNGFVEKLWAMRRIGEIMDDLDLKGRNEELVKELVTLSTKHGILTPYTSFLADENTNLRDVTSNLHEADRRLRYFAESNGAGGVEQRILKNEIAKANRAPQAPADNAQLNQFSLQAPSAATAGRGGFGGGANAPAGAASASGAVATGPTVTLQKDEKESLAVTQNVRQVGQKTFYLRNANWVDSLANEKQEKEAKKIERFSMEYFDLIDKHGKEVAKYLAQDEPLILVLDGEAYQF
ncbi:MAG: VIT and VWA domain-containing protein [Pirellulales bacterium]|nr:VIT and VWA domain-containing protein [Pirellulales bacterium]